MNPIVPSKETKSDRGFSRGRSISQGPCISRTDCKWLFVSGVFTAARLYSGHPPIKLHTKLDHPPPPTPNPDTKQRGHIPSQTPGTESPEPLKAASNHPQKPFVGPINPTLSRGKNRRYGLKVVSHSSHQKLWGIQRRSLGFRGRGATGGARKGPLPTGTRGHRPPPNGCRR